MITGRIFSSQRLCFRYLRRSQEPEGSLFVFKRRDPVRRPNHRDGAGAMLTYDVLQTKDVIVIEVIGLLSEDDFRNLASDLDLHLTNCETLRGILFHARELPPWADSRTVTQHLRCCLHHHHQPVAIALACGDRRRTPATSPAAPSVETPIRHFSYHEPDAALAWLRKRNPAGIAA